MYLKRLLAFLCCFTLVFCLFPSSAFATGGNGNIDGGGGGMGQGTSSNFWTPGNDGVRITVVDASSGTAVSSPLDFSNRTQKTSLLHFGKVNKLQYLSGTGLSLQSGAAYSCIKPAQSMPTIVSSKGQSNIEAIKRYFCSEYASVTFHILGTTYRVNDIVIPAGDSQVVWVKWHTPSTPQTVTITVSVSGAYTAQDTFVAKIVDLNEHIPPDPVATDTNPGYSVPPLPSETQKLTANWGVWSCYWVPVWVWCDHGEDGGHWVDEGYWEYEYTGYSASISGEMSLMPDDIVPTASGKTMKSGYGVKTEVRATLSTDAPTSHITYPQTAFSVFPEFQYQTYLRLLQRSGGQSAKFIFKPNEFSTYDRTVHFTPLWFPDATDYTIYTQVWDTWTPDGMLSINLNDYVSIQGSLYDDWYTNRE